jgi:hypothetical protein
VIKFSIDGKATWVDAHCSEGCKDGSQTGTGPMRVAVDKGDDGTPSLVKFFCANGRKCTMIPPSNLVPFEHEWKVNDGSIEIASCGTVAGIRTSTYPPGDGDVIEVAGNEKKWSQQWKVIAHEAILMNENGSPTQQWEARFIDPPYDYALLPGFSGYSTSTSNAGITNARDREVARAAMYQCDESMALLTGKQTSLGTLKAIADLVNEKGHERMPGTCCFDTPTTNDDFFGVDVRRGVSLCFYNRMLTCFLNFPSIQCIFDVIIQFDLSRMTCKNTGPFHLGISEEACKNAGGKWFRTACTTLKEAIDNRPPRFDLDNPKKKGVVVQKDTTLTNDGRYFNYSPDALKAYFGVDMSLKTNDFIDAKQCRNGVEIYVGKIQVFHPTYRSDRKAGYIGRRDPYDKSNIDNWKDGDILVKISDDCKTPSTPLPWPSTSVDRIFTLVNPTSGKALGLAGTDCQGAR